MNHRLVSIDVLRALAALVVLLNHLPILFTFLPDPFRFWVIIPKTYGCVGVPLFVVLSGYCIHVAVLKNKNQTGPSRVNWLKFWRRRFWRLYPTYFVAMCISLTVYYSVGAESYRDKIQNLPVDLLTHLLLIHNLFRDYCVGLGNGPFWSLGMEEQLYALYFIFLLLRSRFGLRTSLLIALSISLPWSLGLRGVFGTSTWSPGPGFGVEPFVLGHWMQWPFAWWFVWVLGAVAAELNMPGKKPPSWLGSWRIVSLGASVGIFCGEPFLMTFLHMEEAPAFMGLSEFGFGIASFALLNRCIRIEKAGGFRNWFSLRLAGIGVMSYSLYLTHGIVIHVVRETIGPADGRLKEFGTFALSLIGSFVVAWLLFVLVERRFLFHRDPAKASRQSDTNSPPSDRSKIAK